jgi:hypothetical protein
MLTPVLATTLITLAIADIMAFMHPTISLVISFRVSSVQRCLIPMIATVLTVGVWKMSWETWRTKWNLYLCSSFYCHRIRSWLLQLHYHKSDPWTEGRKGTEKKI